ncbi:MAG: HTH domain-containing protein, partial [Desulfobulbaceae bacterium]|nr:HTH domain-containing protein [Desulfobulbaceae bacterium]
MYELLNILHNRRYAVNINDLAAQLECSIPTVKRYLSKLRNEFGAPLRY